MNTFLGIDGGGTKTKFTLCDENGRILAETTTPTCHYLQVGVEGVTDVLSGGLAAVCDIAGVAACDIVYAFVGCPGFGDTESATPALLASVAKAMGPIPHSVGNDCENALSGALAGESGINLIAGTGSMGCGRKGTGPSARCGGWHHAIGSDEGSGYWISYRLLHEFTRQSDGRDEKTPLYDAVKQALDIQLDGDVITRVVDEWGMDRTKVASLSRLIGDLYDRGDPHAAKILEDAASELADIAWALYRQLGFEGSVPVSGTGGVFKLGERLAAPLRKKLAEHNMVLTGAKLPPDAGSLILAFQQSGRAIPAGLLEGC